MREYRPTARLDLHDENLNMPYEEPEVDLVNRLTENCADMSREVSLNKQYSEFEGPVCMPSVKGRLAEHEILGRGGSSISVHTTHHRTWLCNAFQLRTDSLCSL